MAREDNYRPGELAMTWRTFVLGPIMLALFFAALWFNDQNLSDERGPILLGLSFTIAMLWMVLAARDSDNPDSPLGGFIPKMTAFLVLGTSFIAATRWKTDRRVSLIELGFAALYIISGYIAQRTFRARRNQALSKGAGAGRRR
jgi:hypothetical protein